MFNAELVTSSIHEVNTETTQTVRASLDNLKDNTYEATLVQINDSMDE
jgi:hypothetical protein